MARSREDNDLEKEIGKQIGCMAGFFHIFDRPYILSVKRFYTPKGLHPSQDFESASQSEKSLSLRSREVENTTQKRSLIPSPDRRSKQPASTPELKSPASEPTAPVVENQIISPLILPLFELNEGTRSPWKLSREAPRLSLDSRAIVDAKGTLKPRLIRDSATEITSANYSENGKDGAGKQQRSPSVVARLMGIELPSQNPEQAEKSELRRSASESKANRQYRFIDAFNFHLQQQPQHLASIHTVNVIKCEEDNNNNRQINRNAIRDEVKGVYPMVNSRRINEHTEILETLKHLQELQANQVIHMRERSYNDDKSRTTSARSLVQIHQAGDSSALFFRSGTRTRRVAGSSWPLLSSRPDRLMDCRENARNQTRGETRTESSTRSPTRRAALNDSVEHKIVSPVQSPTVVFSRPRPVQKTNPSRTNPIVTPEGSISTCSQKDQDRWKVEEQMNEGTNILHRCDKLLQSIAEMTGTIPATESQLSPVSVLDSSLYNEDSSPSPVMKRILDFTEHQTECEDESWSSAISFAESKLEDCDFAYIFDILRALEHLPKDTDIFLLLEKQQSLNGKCTSRVSRLERRLIFDTTHEILNRKKTLLAPSTYLQPIWAEFQRIRERTAATPEEDMFEVTNMLHEVVKRELCDDGIINGWDDLPVKMSEAVLEIERLLFKDLISETICDLPNISGLPRRKLVF